MHFARSQRRVRASLYLSAAGLGLALTAPGVAQAQSLRASDVVESPHTTVRIADLVEEAHSGAPVSVAQQSGFVNPVEVVETPNIVINNNFTPTDARDPVNITGVGQVFTDAGGGSIGLCTGTLINPRTIIFAAHCVNSRAATAYGAGSGGVAASIGFETNTRANGPGQSDELVNWLLGGSTGPGQFKTNQAQALYNISQVFYDPRSMAPTSCTSPTSCFLEADVATAVLDTPTRNIPTWALLFSPLPTPGTINPATGTGYHVTITGYGRNGTGTTGAVGNDFRRRAAENMLGALVSLNTRNEFLFGTPGTPSRPQVLYFLDFDDPARGTAGANPRDFNGFRDNALPREGSTGPGDSGGPLILDQTFSKSVVIGVLSGGSTFFTGQPGGSYGTQSFYQPLFLYWDWIVANNPYRYVTATAGNKNWEDTTAWLTELDPNYQIIAGGQLVNGLPTNLGGGPTGSSPQFGEMCFQSPSSSSTPATNLCTNIATGLPRDNVPNNPSDSNGPLVADLTGTSGMTPIESAQADPGYSDTVRPAPTIANGLPGATGFTPNNVDGVRTTGQMGRYYDVTLRNTGVVTLNSAVTIDRFSIMGATSQLTIAAGASLTSLIEIRQNTGTILNNGTLTSPGDYLLLSGLLTGTGTVNAPFTTAVLGSIAPGTLTTPGTLTFNGNLVMSSGAGYLVDLGASGTSDRIVVAGAGNQANLGGTLQLSFSAATLRGGNTYTILTAQGGITGTFNTPASLSAILRPTLTYSTNAVTLNIVAGNYRDVVSPTNTIAYTYARILDWNRGRAANYDSLYGPLDLQNAATINSTLGALAPATESTVQTLGFAAVDSNANFIRNRIQNLDASHLDGTVARYGRPIQVAALGLSPAIGAKPIANDMAAPLVLQEGALPDNMSGFISGGYLTGDGQAMTGIGGRDNFNGWYVGGGIEVAAGDNGFVGFALSYSDIDGTASLAGQTAQNQAFQGTIYAKTSTTGGLTFDGHVTAGALNAKTRRSVNFLGTPYTLRSSDSALVLSTELGISKNLGGDAFEVTPRIAGRGTYIGFGSALESGGPVALDLQRQEFSSWQGRAGITLGAGKASKVRPFVTGTYVHEFSDQPGVVFANLVGAPSGGFSFALNGQDKDWAEVSGGLTFKAGAVDLSVSADTTLARSDLSVQTYRGSITFRF
ncbi:autotransporter domain-containing protein [Sphingomonas koreensis]